MHPPTDDAASAASLSAAPPLVQTALEALDAAGVRWCLLRDAHDVTGAAEVDLLVRPGDLKTMRHAVERHGGFLPLTAWGRAPHRFFVADAGPEGARVKLDVVDSLAFGRHGELRTDHSVAELVLARRRREGALSVPAPGDALWALLLHVVLDRRTVRPQRADEVRALAAQVRDDSALTAVVEAACPPGWSAARILDAAAAGSFDELLALSGALRARWPGAGRPRAALRVAASAALRRADRLHAVRAWRARARARAAQQSGLMTSNSRLRSTG